MQIEIIYAASKLEQIQLQVEVPKNTTVLQAIETSELLTKYPEIKLAQYSIAIFGIPSPLEKLVKSGDRIEICRPLTQDPQTARIKRVKESRRKK